jgi:DNA-binding NarL/FixJ family response regulator
VSAEAVVVDPGELGELLAALFSQYGIEAVCARTGEEALEVVLAENPGVVIVESDLSDVDGLELAELFKEEVGVKVILTYPHHRLGDDDRESFIERMRVADASYSRPFRSRTLIETAARLLGYEVDPELSGEFMIVRDTPREEKLLEDAKVPEPPKDQTGEIEREPLSVPVAQLEEAPHKAAAADLLAKAREAPAPAPKAASLGERSGRLTPKVLASLLDAFHQTQTTGEIWLQRAEAKRVVLIVRGVIVGARTNIRSEQLEVIAEKRLLLDGPRIAQIHAAMAADKDKTFREAALELELLDDASLRRLLHEQARRIVLASFAWRDGRFKETLVGHGKQEPHRIELPVGDVILRGLQLTESLDALREAAPDDARFGPHPDPPYLLHELALSGQEPFIVVAADGTKTVSDLRALFPNVDERTLRGLLAGLQRLGLLSFAGHGPAKPKRISFF